MFILYSHVSTIKNILQSPNDHLTKAFYRISTILDRLKPKLKNTEILNLSSFISIPDSTLIYTCIYLVQGRLLPQGYLPSIDLLLRQTPNWTCSVWGGLHSPLRCNGQVPALVQVVEGALQVLICTSNACY